MGLVTTFVTESGSTYKVDHEFKTWVRLEKDKLSGNLRSECGTFDFVNEIKCDSPVMLMCPPFKEGGPPRMICTSPVIDLRTRIENTS